MIAVSSRPTITFHGCVLHSFAHARRWGIVYAWLIFRLFRSTPGNALVPDRCVAGVEQWKERLYDASRSQVRFSDFAAVVLEHVCCY